MRTTRHRCNYDLRLIFGFILIFVGLFVCRFCCVLSLDNFVHYVSVVSFSVFVICFDNCIHFDYFPSIDETDNVFDEIR